MIKAQGYFVTSYEDEGNSEIVLGSRFGCSTSRTTEEGETADLDGEERYLDILRRVHEHGGVLLHRDTSRHGMRARRQENCAIDLGESVSLGPSHHDMAMAESPFG